MTQKDRRSPSLVLLGRTDADLTLLPPPVARTMEDVARECREREEIAIRTHRVADAALYAEVADRALAVIARERELNYARRTATGDERALLRRRTWWQQVIVAAIGVAIAVSLGLLFGSCTAVPPGVQSVGAIEAYGGAGLPTGKGNDDVQDVGAYGVLGLGVAAPGRSDPNVGWEGWIEGGHAAGEVDAHDLGLFDLDMNVLRAGAGLRVAVGRVAGLDCSIGLGACLTVADGQASAGTLSRDVHEGGAGAYASAIISRGPLFLLVRYVHGPSADVEDESVELGGLTAAAGLRWEF
jgi:hypothetical protein